MAGFSIARPTELGIDPGRLRGAVDLLKSWVDAGQIPAAGVCLGRHGRIVEPIFVGTMPKEPLFLVASLTKPITVMAAMILVERGRLTLDDRVASFVPKFGANGKQDVRIRHLMTHTSGLPDMPPDNLQLRRTRQPLAAFVESTCRLSLLFEPGTKVNYQSMGTAILGEVVHQISGQALPEFLRREIFAPMGMSETSLGWRSETQSRIVPVRLPEPATEHEKIWNSPYWLGFGAPWGGLITTPTDYAQICQLFLSGGAWQGSRILSPASVRAMATNQLQAFPRLAEEDRRCRPWGLGWRLNWPGSSASFGDLLGPRSFGHMGATGTMAWIDPDADAFAVVLTTQPQEPEGRYLAKLSNALCAALS